MEIDTSTLCEEAIKFDGLDRCLIGTDQRGYLVYSFQKIVDYFQNEGMSLDDAVEYTEFNVVGIKPDHYTVVYDLIKNEI